MKRERHNVRVQIVAPESWLHMIETFMSQHPRKISKSEAIRTLTEKALHEFAA